MTAHGTCRAWTCLFVSIRCKSLVPYPLLPYCTVHGLWQHGSTSVGSAQRSDAVGQEGFAGNSTPLYMYSNPGAWASLLGVDFVRNNKAKGIDYATMHIYVDQWLCVEEGSTRKGQLDFMK